MNIQINQKASNINSSSKTTHYRLREIGHRKILILFTFYRYTWQCRSGKYCHSMQGTHLISVIKLLLTKNCNSLNISTLDKSRPPNKNTPKSSEGKCCFPNTNMAEERSLRRSRLLSEEISSLVC